MSYGYVIMAAGGSWRFVCQPVRPSQPGGRAMFVRAKPLGARPREPCIWSVLSFKLNIQLLPIIMMLAH